MRGKYFVVKNFRELLRMILLIKKKQASTGNFKVNKGTVSFVQ
jgi:hypothetical protein